MEHKSELNSRANLKVAAVARSVDLIPCPANNATQLTLPTVHEGYAITIEKTEMPDVTDASKWVDSSEVIDITGKITRSDNTTYRIRVTFRVTDKADSNVYALTKPLLVPIYKTYVKPNMSLREVQKKHEEYQRKAYGMFFHMISKYGTWDLAASTYRDGTKVQTVDELAESVDASAFAKAVNELGVEYVVFTVWHGETRALFPSMTNQRWRDDRVAKGSFYKKTYSDRDVISDLLEALEPYGIDLHLYTHPCDGHDFTKEEQLLTGWDEDQANGYPKWNQYTNELYYELCERYGDRIAGLWFDGGYKHIPVGEPQERLRKTCQSFNPAMILTMNTAFLEGELNPLPEHNCPDYRAWELRTWEYVDYRNTKISRYQWALILAGKTWWTMGKQSDKFEIQPIGETFQFLVALSSVSTHGGFLASTGFFPIHKGEEKEELDEYFMGDIYKTMKSLNDEYLQPVKEAVLDTNDSKAYPTIENITVSQLDWGVANESRDGRYIYLHVLNAPEGNILNLPATKDGTLLNREAMIMKFDGTQVPIVIERKWTTAGTISGYSVSLPEGMNWSEIDTVIKAERELFAL